MKVSSIAVVITAHKEGNLLLPTLVSANDAIKECAVQFPEVDLRRYIFLDNPDSLTLEVAESISREHDIVILKGAEGDPGLARMSAISHTKEEFIAFLDGDDLWSENWLASSVKSYYLDGNKSTVYHPEYNLIFGASNQLVRQGCPEDPFYSTEFLRFTNYWDALCFCHRSIFDDVPIPGNSKEEGFEHEDFLWNCRTIENGILHKLVKNTIHFKRRRSGSVSVLAEGNFSKRRPSPISFYDYEG